MGEVISNQLAVISRRALICLFIAVFAGCKKGDQHVSDDVLVKTFQDRRADFEKLGIMIREDATLEQVTFKSTLPTPAPIDDKRLSAYRQMLASMGCEAGLWREGNNVYLIASENDFGKKPGYKPSHKGFFHCPVKPSLLADKLDNYPFPEPENHVVYRPLEDNWYLFVTRGGPTDH